VVRPAPLLPLAVLGLSLLACKGEVPVPGKERVGTYLLQSVGDPLSNDCVTAILAPTPDAGGGVYIDAGVVVSVTFNNTTAPDGGNRLPDGGPFAPYDAGYLTFVEGSGSEYGTYVGQVIDVSALAPRVFTGCGCTSLAPPDIVVDERNVLALLSPSQAQALGSTTVCPSPDVLLDGGIPSGGGIVGPRSNDGVWNVPLVCGFTEERVQVLGPSCDGGCQSCTIRFFAQGRPLAQ
jgi:hypothetical protein